MEQLLGLELGKASHRFVGDRYSGYLFGTPDGKIIDNDNDQTRNPEGAGAVIGQLPEGLGFAAICQPDSHGWQYYVVPVDRLQRIHEVCAQLDAARVELAQLLTIQ